MKPTLATYVRRYNKDKELLVKYPDQSELLEKRIKRHKEDIITYVTTNDQFLDALEHLNI